MTLTGHVSVDAQDVVPMVFYSMGPDAADVGEENAADSGQGDAD